MNKWKWRLRTREENMRERTLNQREGGANEDLEPEGEGQRVKT